MAGSDRQSETQNDFGTHVWTKKMSTHLDAAGKAIMIDVSDKAETARTAVAEGVIRLSAEALAAIRDNNLKKGDALAAARVAGIMAAKNAQHAIPLCHTIPLSGCDIGFELGDGMIRVRCRVRCVARTGAEMEALCGAATALLTLYDMAKSIDRTMEIGGLRLVAKSGGKSGDYRRETDGE